MSNPFDPFQLFGPFFNEIYLLDNLFEPERKSLQTRLGINLSQREFTGYLAKSNAKIRYPKRDLTFAPQKSKRGRFTNL